MVKVACTIQLTQKYQIQEYHAIEVFASGKGDKNIEIYQGPRGTAGIVQNALDKLEKFVYIPKLNN